MKKDHISIGIILSSGFSLSTLGNFLDAFRLAADDLDKSRQLRFSWEAISSSGQYIRSSSRLEVIPTKLLNSSIKYDYLVIIADKDFDIDNFDETINEFVSQYLTMKRNVVALCGGVIYLAKRRLLSDYKVCISQYLFKDFVKRFPLVKASCEELYLQDKNLFTSAGGIGAIQLAAHIITIHYGKAVAEKALRIMIESVKVEKLQKQPVSFNIQEISNVHIRAATEIVIANMKENYSIYDISNILNISIRQLERVFVKETGLTPIAFMKKIRLHIAIKDLVNTDFSIEYIAKETGFHSNSHFSKSFRQEFLCSPSEMRKNFYLSKSNN